MDGVDIGRLIAFATDATASPGSSGQAGEYARLIEKYLSDAAFRLLVDDVAEGAGCTVSHAAPREGLILRSQPDGPWAWPERSTDLPWNRSFSKSPNPAVEKAARMLVIPALLAYISPSAADYDDQLADPTLSLPLVTVRELEVFIRDFAARQEAGSPDPSDEERPAWWHWLQSAGETATTERIGRSTTGYVVFDMLQYLSQIGLLIKVSGSSHDTVYRPRRRILHHYRDMLLNELYAAISQYAEDQARAADAPTIETEG
jgi:hypothetical protein